MNNRSAALFRASNLRIMDYPFPAALASALSVCDEAVVVVGQSEDDTLDWVQALARKHAGRVAVHETTFTFDRGWQERWWALASSLTDADWLMYHDADECVHEDDAPQLRAMLADPDIGLIRFDWWHFYGTANWRRIKGNPQYNARLGRRSRGWRMENWCTDATPHWPACQMVFGDDGLEAHSVYQGPGIAGAPGPLYHYGNCRDARALAISRAKHLAWYAGGDGLADGHVPDVEPLRFEIAAELRAGNLVPYDGPHPAAIRPWLDAHAAQWAALEAQCFASA